LTFAKNEHFVSLSNAEIEFKKYIKKFSPE